MGTHPPTGIGARKMGRGSGLLQEGRGPEGGAKGEAMWEAGDVMRRVGAGADPCVSCLPEWHFNSPEKALRRLCSGICVLISFILFQTAVPKKNGQRYERLPACCSRALQRALLKCGNNALELFAAPLVCLVQACWGQMGPACGGAQCV